MLKVKVTAIGNSMGIVLPKEALAKLRAEKGDVLYLVETPEGMTLTPYQGILCLEAIPDRRQRNQVQQALEKSGKTILPLQLAQVAKFAGNMLSIGPPGRRPLLVMSRTAAESLRAEQRLELDRECDVLTFCIPTIERYGGGSIRCMLAENYLD